VTRRRMVWIGAWLAAVVLVAALGAIAVLRSQWFFNRVRLAIVDNVESATGGRVEAGAFAFDWTRLRAEVRGFTVHGKEPAGKPPLFRASSVAVGLHVQSVLRRAIDIRSRSTSPTSSSSSTPMAAPTSPSRR